MITTGSKFFYALAGVLLVTAVVYGYSTGGGEVGPLTMGYKGGVGDHLGYGILLAGAVAAAFAGFCTTAFRDADAEAGAALLGVEALPTPAPTGASYWPVVGAFGVALVVVGAVLNNVFFVVGLLVLAAVAIEWTMQAWADRATGDPAVNREIRNRVMLPIEVPVAGALIILVVVLGFSRVFLAVSQLNAVWVALGVAATVFAVGTALSLRPKIRTDVVAGLLVLAAVLTIGAGIFGAVSGEREFEHHGEEHAEEGGENSTDAGSGEDADSEGVGEETPEDAESGAAGAEENP